MGRRKELEPVNFAIYWRLLGYIRPYLKLAILCILASLLISILHFASIGMIKPLGDVLFGDGIQIFLEKVGSYGELGKQFALFLEKYMFSNPQRTLYSMMIMVLIMVAIKNLLRFCHDYLTGYITNRATVDISNELFGKVLRLPRRFFSEEGVTEISGRFAYDIPMLGLGLRSIFGKAIREPLKAFSTLFLALLINWQLTLITFFIFPPALLFIKRIGKKVKRGAKKTLAKSSNILHLLQESFMGIDVVKAYQMEPQRQEKFGGENKKWFRYSMKVVVAESATSPIMETFITTCAIGVLIFSAQMVFDHTMSEGDFCAFYAALGALFDPVRKLADVYNRINASNAAGERVFKLMDTEPEFNDEKNAVELPPLQESITFQNVDFSYKPDTPILRDLSFTVQKGESIAVVGPNGAGKTTLISLLLRFYDVNQGAILIDGHDIRKVTMESLRRQIGLVTQQSFLFNESVAVNISCRDTDNLSLEEVEKAAQMADAHKFLAALSQGYQTIYGKGGVDFSGGQKHRITLARAIMKQPNILILDEAMANIDVESEHYIKQTLEEFTQGRTTFIIAHRFSTIEQADRILVLNQGRLEGFGSHEELIQSSETYRNLYLHQTENIIK